MSATISVSSPRSGVACTKHNPAIALSDPASPTPTEQAQPAYALVDTVEGLIIDTEEFVRCMCDLRSRVDQQIRNIEAAGRLDRSAIATARVTLASRIAAFKDQRAAGALTGMTSAEFIRRVRDMEQSKTILIRRLKYRGSRVGVRG
jgi:hypothetical protein